MIQRMLKRKVWFGGSISAVTPASQWRRQKTPMILQIAPLTNQISVLGGIVVPIADVGCHKKCPAMVKVGLSRFQKLIGGIGKRVLQIVPKMSGKFVQSGFGK